MFFLCPRAHPPCSPPRSPRAPSHRLRSFTSLRSLASLLPHFALCKLHPPPRTSRVAPPAFPALSSPRASCLPVLSFLPALYRLFSRTFRTAYPPSLFLMIPLALPILALPRRLSPPAPSAPPPPPLSSRSPRAAFALSPPCTLSPPCPHFALCKLICHPHLYRLFFRTLRTAHPPSPYTLFPPFPPLHICVM